MPRKTPSPPPVEPLVLVGTYHKKQLDKWILPKGLYNYPLYGDDTIDPAQFGRISELWLFLGTKAQRTFNAEFVGVVERSALKDYDYPKDMGKPHASQYLLFRVSERYGSALESPSVIVRARDFEKRSAKVCAQIRDALKSSDKTKRDSVARLLPSIILDIPSERLCVCEGALQLDFSDLIFAGQQQPAVRTPAPPPRKPDAPCVIGQLPEHRICTEDALRTLRGLPDNSVQLVLTSPPYNIGKEYETERSIDEYLANLNPILAEIARVVSDAGSVCWQTGNYIHDGEVFPLDMFFYPVFKRLGFKLRNRIIWHFGHGLHCSHRFSGRYETILWFSKGDHYTFNLDSVRIPSKYPGKRYYKGAKKGQLSGNPLGKNPEDAWTIERLIDDWDTLYWEIPNVKNNHPEKVDHPCQFPVELCERCVLALTDEDDLVYDPFCGVASTLIAALKNKRRALGSELEPRYVKTGEERIQKLAEGKLLLRPISQKLYVPPPNSKLAHPVQSQPA